jgi:hypothetical protein
MIEVKQKKITELNSIEARAFLLRHKSYCTFDLPPYFDFSMLLSEISNKIIDHSICDYFDNGRKPHECEDVNYNFYESKVNAVVLTRLPVDNYGEVIYK